MEREVLPLRDGELSSRPADRTLRKQVALDIRALVAWTAVEAADPAVDLPLCDSVLGVRRGEKLVDRTEPAAFGQL